MYCQYPSFTVLLDAALAAGMSFGAETPPSDESGGSRESQPSACPTVAEQTSDFLSPMDAEGYIDHEAALNEHLRQGSEIPIQLHPPCSRNSGIGSEKLHKLVQCLLLFRGEL